MLDLYLNGEFLSQDQARVSVMDRGFLFGDSVYEVIPAYGGHPFRWEHHLQRLAHSLQAIGIDNPLEDEVWASIFNQLTAQLPGQDQQLYLQVTRGVMDSRDHQPKAGISPTVLVMTTPLKPRDPAIAEHGVSAITLPDIRWQRCDIKATTLLANVLAKREATARGADEAILIRDGLAQEGSASNVFIVRQGLLITPPKGECILPGITRDLVLELAAEAGLPYAEAAISEGELAQADEVWLTSSSREIMPVTRLNDRPVSDGRPGPLWRQLDAGFDAYKARMRLYAREGGRTDD